VLPGHAESVPVIEGDAHGREDAALGAHPPTLDTERMRRHGSRTMGCRNRSANEGGPTLGARVLMNEIEQLARAKHLVGRVAYKMNDKGEHVVALIFPPQPP